MKASLTQLLVHLDGSPLAARRLDAACRIAQAQGAAVTALYAVTSALVLLPFPEGSGAAMASIREIDDERRTAARALFEQLAGAAGVHATWAEVQGDPIIAAFVQQALYADLTVLGQHDPAESRYSGVPSDFAETVMTASGKAALIVPYVGALARIGDTVAIAWKPTREAARAVAAAMPLLQRARRVHVVSWTGPEETIAGSRLDLPGYLRQHGVEATWHSQGDEPESVGELLLSFAFDLGADLLVMGCYGHNRAREWVLGGASRTLLRSMTLPVLMAH